MEFTERLRNLAAAAYAGDPAAVVEFHECVDRWMAWKVGHTLDGGESVSRVARRILAATRRLAASAYKGAKWDDEELRARVTVEVSEEILRDLGARRACAGTLQDTIVA